MKIFTSCQKAVEKRVGFYISQLERAEEKEKIEHMVQCGSMLKEHVAEIEAYSLYKLSKSIPDKATDVPEPAIPEADKPESQTQAEKN